MTKTDTGMTTKSIYNSLDVHLSSIGRALAVLEATLDRAASCESIKVETASGMMWQQEVAHLNKLMTGVFILMKEPTEGLEDLLEKLKACICQPETMEAESCTPRTPKEGAEQ